MADPDNVKADYADGDRDMERILSLNWSEYGPESPEPSTDVVSTRESFHWRKEQNPAGHAVIPVLRTAGGEIAGFIWLIPQRMRIAQKDYLAATGANLLIGAECRGVFGYVKLMRQFSRALKQRGAPLHFSFVSKEVYNRLSTEAPDTICKVPLLVKPLDFAALLSVRLSQWPRLLGRTAAWLLSPYFLRWPFVQLNADIHVEMKEQFDESFDLFWKKVQDKHRAVVIRDRAFLHWRFSSVEARRYRILVARLQGEMLGYVVLRCAEVRGVGSGLIMDLLLLDGEKGKEAGIRLLEAAEAFFRNEKMSILLALMSPGCDEHQVLRLLGCRNLAPIYDPRPFRFGFFVQDSYQQELRSLRVQDWFVTLADFESL